MDGIQYLKLVADARAFRQSAWLVEREIGRLGAKPSETAPLGGAAGWPSQTVWEALKTASHFNLGIAFELRIKCLLHLADVKPYSGTDGHRLGMLYGQLPSPVPKRLEGLYQKSLNGRALMLTAFLNAGTPDTPPRPPNTELKTLHEWCIYFDKEMRLWEKRYSWEAVSEGVWRHYVENLDPLLSFVDKIESLGAELARKKRLIL